MSAVGDWLASFVRASGFLERHPYYAAVLARITAVEDPGVSYMAVSFEGGRYVLHVNPASFVQHAEYLPGILQHEVHHVIFGHLVHPKFRDVADAERMSLAMEMSANEYIESPLPDPIVWKAFARFGLAAGQSTMERYDLLMAALHAGAGMPEPRTCDDHRPWPSDLPHPGAVEATRQLVDDAIRSVARSDDAGEAVVRKRFKLAGHEPGEVLEALSGTRDAVRVQMDWREALRRFSARVRVPMPTYARPNRRFLDAVGVVPGRRFTQRSLAKPRVVVALDTSHSMSRNQLAEIARQLREMSEHADLVVVECDAKVTRVYGFSGSIDAVKGRGGTDLRPVFAPAFLAAQRADGVVYFTDGEGQTPDRPPAVPVLWVLTGGGDFACKWGAQTRMELVPPSGSPKTARAG